MVDALRIVSTLLAPPTDNATDRVLLLLDLDNSAVLEGPLDNVGLVGGALDPVALVKSGPELAEVLELDQVPDIAEWRLDDGRLADGGGSGDTGRHCDSCEVIELRCSVGGPFD